MWSKDSKNYGDVPYYKKQGLNRGNYHGLTVVKAHRFPRHNGTIKWTCIVNELVFIIEFWENPNKKIWTHSCQNPMTNFWHRKNLALWKCQPLMKENVCSIQKMININHEEMLGHEFEIHVGATVAPSFPPASTPLFSLLVVAPIYDCDFWCLVESGLLPLPTNIDNFIYQLLCYFKIFVKQFDKTARQAWINMVSSQEEIPSMNEKMTSKQEKLPSMHEEMHGEGLSI